MAEPEKNTAVKSTETKNDTTPVKFKLSVNHTHQGEDLEKGKVITLRKEQADRMGHIGSIVNG